MALTEKSRSALYQGLRSVVDEEAVQEMLSYFPTRDADESVSREFLRAEMSLLRMDVREEMRSEIGGLREEMRSEIGGLREEMRSEIGGLRDEMRSEIRRSVLMNLGMLVAFAAALIAAVRV